MLEEMDGLFSGDVPFDKCLVVMGSSHEWQNYFGFYGFYVFYTHQVRLILLLSAKPKIGKRYVHSGLRPAASCCLARL